MTNRTAEQKKRYNIRQTKQRQNDPTYPRREKGYLLKSRYGVTLKEFDHIIESQGGHCAVCNNTTDLAMDHDHSNGLPRGVLCKQHNIALGYIERNKTILHKLLDYINYYDELGR